MRIALRELRRRFRRFLPTASALVLLVLLLLLLGGLLDGLYLGSTGALRAQESDLAVYSRESRDSTIRSRIEPGTRRTIAAVPGVERTHGLGFALVGARVPGEPEIANTAVAGYQGSVNGVPPPPPRGQAWADRRLEADGVDEGDVLELGPERVPVTVVGWVEDTTYLQQGALWVEPGTWREVLNRSRPGAAVGPGTFQTLWVEIAPGADPARVARRIDAATDGTTNTLTRTEAVNALPGIKEQRTTFNQIIVVTFFVAGLVVALFFALLTLERVGLYGVLKAIGASSRQLVGGLALQALVISAASFAVGALLAFGLAAMIPPDVPIRLTASRAWFVGVGILVTALIGGAVSLRRVVSVDPASTIGAGT